MGAGYRVRGRTAATVATSGHAIAGLWNPHTTQRMTVTEFAVFKTAAGTAADAFMLQRMTARGTAGSTVTPAIQNAEARDIAPASGALLDLAAYSVQPTLEANGLMGWVASAVAASGIIYPCAIDIPPGAGLVITQQQATIWPISEVHFRWEE